MVKNILNIIIAIVILQFAFSSCSKSNSEDEVDMELIPVEMGGKCGYVDHQGKFVINPQFKLATAFHEGLAVVYTFDGKAGYINKEGKFVIPAVYAQGTHFCNGVAFVVRECSTPICIDVNGKELFHTTEDIFTIDGFSKEGLARFVTMDDKSGFMDKSGKITIPAQYTNTLTPNEGLMCVRTDNDKFGFVNTQGQYVINPQFDGASVFEEGFAAVQIDKQWGYIDKKGSIVINPQFDAAHIFKNGLASVRQGSKWGVINKEGVFVINPQFDNLGDFSKNGLASFKLNGQYGYIDKKGKIVINPQFDYASEFYGDIAFVEFDKKCGAIDESGKYVINPQFDAIGDLNFATLSSSLLQSLNFNKFVNTVYSTTYYDSPILDYIIEKNQWLNDTYENTIGKTAEMGEYDGNSYAEGGTLIQCPTIKDELAELMFVYDFDMNLSSAQASKAKLTDYFMLLDVKFNKWSRSKKRKFGLYLDKFVNAIEKNENVKFSEWNGRYCAEKASTLFILSIGDEGVLFIASKDQKQIPMIKKHIVEMIKQNAN